MNATKKINILMISSSSSLGGGTKHMFLLGENLKKEFNIFYAVPLNNNFSKKLNSKNHLVISERKINFRDVINLKRFIELKSIDIIHAHGKGAGVISRLTKLFVKSTLIYTFHGIHLRCHPWHKRSIYIIYEFLLGWFDSRKILVSKSEKEYAINSNIYLGNKSLIINNGVSNKNIKEFKKTNKKINQDNELSKIKILTICRFVNQKNIREILKIALNLPTIDFYIIGNGPLWDEINFLILENRIKNVFLMGEKKDIFKYLYSSDIYLSTSLYEGLPLSILEAMSVGLPIVASDVIGNRDTIENDKTGYLYQVHNIQDAVLKIKTLSKSLKARKKFGEAAFKRQRYLFSKELMIKKYIYLYKTVMLENE